MNLKISTISRTPFTCVRDGKVIRGTQYRPEGTNLPVAVLSHGFMANQHSMMKYARRLASWGYAAFCYDFSGGCIKGKSDGKTTDMTVLTEKEDLKAVIRYVKSLGYVNPNHLILMGCSQGGFVSALTAAEIPEQVSRLILFYPALCIPDDARRGQMMMATFDPKHIPDTIQCGPMLLGHAYPAAVLHMDPYREICSYSGPVLIVHGTNDEVVKLSYAQKAAKAYPDSQLLVIGGAGHGFSLKEDETALYGIKQFLQGKREVLTVNVRLTGSEILRKGLINRVALPFTGTANSPYFKGKILPGASDVQDRIGRKPVKFRANYTLEGKDYTDVPCKIHILNTNSGSEWKPQVSTDSKALAFLNGADCTAYLQGRASGPVVRIYAKVPQQKGIL